jgi:hypothetical protein
MHHELKEFMRRVYRDNGDNILKQQLDSIDLLNVDYASLSQRKMLSENIRAILPMTSFAKTNLLYAELLKILNLDVIDIGKDTFEAIQGNLYYDEDGNEVTYEEILMSRDDTYKDPSDANASRERKKYFTSKEEYVIYQKERQIKVITSFWRNVDRSLTKFEVVFNLFWLKAGEAEIRGLNHEDVMHITNKALLGIKKDIEINFEDVKKQFGMLKPVEKKVELKFHFKDIPPILLKKHEQDKVDKNSAGETEIIESIDEFWHTIDGLYNKFKEVFIISMNKDIELKKRNMNDTQLVKVTEDRMLEIWKVIEQSYSNLQKKLDRIQNNN